MTNFGKQRMFILVRLKDILKFILNHTLEREKKPVSSSSTSNASFTGYLTGLLEKIK